MRQFYTMFPIEKVDEIPFEYRLLKVVEAIPQDDQEPIRMQKWADELWRRRLKQPVFPVTRNGAHCFLVPAHATLDGIDLTFEDVPNRTYHLQALPETLRITGNGIDHVERAFVARTIERALSDCVVKNRTTLWRDTTTRFFRKQPLNAGVVRDRVNAYRGFQFTVLSAHPAKLFLALDLLTRYIGRLSLGDYRALGRLTELAGHCDVPLRQRLSLLRDNGTSKYPCFFAGWVGQSVSEVQVADLGLSVYEYYTQKYPELKVRADDQAVYVVGNKADAKTLVVPASRLFPVFTTECDEVRFCSVKPTLAPSERIQAIQDIRGFFDGAQVVGVNLELGRTLASEGVRSFLPPALEFGRGKKLTPLASLAGSTFGNWNRDKLSLLYSDGLYHGEPITSVWLLHPTTVSRESRTMLLESLSDEMGRMGLKLPQARQISYSVDPNGRDLLKRTQEILGTTKSGMILCVLTDAFKPQVHGEFKRAASSLRSQCVTERKIDLICSSKPKLRNLALAVATASGSKPWVLGNSLSADLHIGIDVLQGRAILNYLFGPGGREVIQKPALTQKEAIRKRVLCEELVGTISQIVAGGYPVKSIVIHRDGRAWPVELAAMEEAFRDLVKSGVLPADVRVAVAEVRKSHAPVRIVHQDTIDSQVRWRNPFPGCFLVLTPQAGFVNTTGRPVEWDGQRRTASTLFVNVVYGIGEVEIEAILRDIFYLTQLNWSAPDIDINLPVTIRWADDALREDYLPSDPDD